MLSSDQIELICSSELLQRLGVMPARELAAIMEIVALRDGEILVRPRDLNDNLYIVLSGRLAVSMRNPRGEAGLLFDVEPGESVGSMGIRSHHLASVTVTAAGGVQVAALSRTVFQRFSDLHPQAARHLIDSLSRTLHRQRMAIALRLSRLFDALDSKVMRDLGSDLEEVSLYGGEVLYRQGDPADFLCIVISGRLRVRVFDGQGKETSVTELGPGELVGEMAVVTNQPRTATIEAVRDTQLAKLTKAGFEHFAARHPRAAVQMVSHKLAESVRETTSGQPRRTRNIITAAIVAAHPSAPSTEFAKSLASALAAFGPTLHLTSQLVDDYFGEEGIAQTYERDGGSTRLVEWLSNQEIDYSYVLYEADPYLSPWTERSIRQADHIIVVADSQADPSPGEIENELLDSRAHPAARQWLALVHRTANPSGTRRWLEQRQIERHFHVMLGEATGFGRLARFLTGRAVGLTLGGGFARGLAHVGVFRAFENLGVAIDAMGGASMGALVGALWAMGWDRERIIKETSDACSGLFGDLTFPFIAFKTGRKFSDAVRKLFGEVQIEDLWTPYFCISANLNRSELKIHAQGSLTKAILAATRAPGVFPPIVYDGELHVDGGVINNVPVDLMKTFCNEGITVGVDVSPPHELNTVADYGDNVSGWKAFWKRCSPFSKSYVYTPSILLVMIRTLEYSGISYKNVRTRLADIYMHPELLKFKRTDFHLVNEIAQAGYDCAWANVLEWLTASDIIATRRPDLEAVLRSARESHSKESGSLLIQGPRRHLSAVEHISSSSES